MEKRFLFKCVEKSRNQLLCFCIGISHELFEPAHGIMVLII